MTHKLITIPDAILRTKSKRIGFVDDSIKTLAEEMKALTLEWDHESELGVAMAAIQVGEPMRLTVIRDNLDNSTGKTFSVFVNPEIVKRSEKTVSDVEGCLSVPGVYGRVERSIMIKVKATDLDGTPIRITAEGFVARVFAHEIDHMNGIMFLDHIKSAEDLFSIDAKGKLSPLDPIPAAVKKYL